MNTQMRSIIRYIIILSVVVAVLLGIVIALLLNPVQADSGIIVISSGEPIDISSVTVKNESGEFCFYFDAVENGYVLDDIPPYLADTDVFINFMTVCAGLTALKSIPAEDISIEETGLDTPAAQVLIEFFDGSSVDLSIGAPERISGNFYAHVARADELYIIPHSSAQQFLLPKTQIITSYVTPPANLSSPLSAIYDIIFYGGRFFDNPVMILRANRADGHIMLDAMSFGAPTHIVRGEVDYQLDQTYGAVIFGSLLGLRGEIVEYNLQEDNKAKYGFDNPYMMVGFDMQTDANAPLSHFDLLIADAGDGSFYASTVGSSAVYLIGREPFIDIEYAKLPVRWFLTPLLLDLRSVTVESPDALYHFEIDNTDSRNPIITYGGNTLSVDLFRSFYRLITSAAHDGTYPGPHPAPDGESLLTITYEYNNEEKQADTLALFPGVSGRANVYINGFGEFSMKDLFVQRVLDGVQNLISGNTIEENW